MIQIPQPRSQVAYIIQNNGQYFHTGRSGNGEQVLLGIVGAEDGVEVMSVWFDITGRLLNVRSELVTPNPGESEDAAARRVLLAFQCAIGYHPATIRVERFSVPNYSIRIEDIPEHYQEFIDNLGDYEPQRQEELAADIRQWVQDGDYVLWWGEDYYLDKKGEVVSS